MRLPERALLLLYALCFTVISFLFLLLSLNFLMPLQIIQNIVLDATGRIITGLVSAAFFLVGIRLIFFSPNRRKEKQTLIEESALGKVQVSLLAVENLVKRLVREMKGIRDVKAVVRNKDDKGIDIKIRLVVSPEVNVPSICGAIQKSTKEYVLDIVGVEVSNVTVIVENITSEPKARVD